MYGPYYKLITCIMSMLICTMSVAKQSMNELSKVFYHRVNDNQEAVNIDLGKIVFYFSKEPIINRLPRANDAQNTITLFLPVTKASEQARSKINDINKHASSLYTIHFDMVSKPVPGIMCTIAYDPTQVGFAYETFDSIGLQKGLVFRFYNKTIIEQLHAKHATVLRTASAQQAKPGVIIDCGHGGSDDGTVGCFNIKEKDITRSVGLKVAHLLQREGFPVFLTRTADESVELDERTTFANRCDQATLLVSIHANSAPNTDSRGIETFCLTDTLFTPYTSARDTRLHTYLHDLNQRSILLANALQDQVLSSVKKKQNTIVDRKVKHSVSQVLIGTTKPAALIEIGFLSNQDEARLLADQTYQQTVAQGIYRGICAYLLQVA